MKKILKKFHNEMILGFYPIHPIPIYVFVIIALLSIIIIPITTPK
jgi:hypothetical protein